MSKKTTEISVQGYIVRREAISVQLNELADKLEAEKREMTAEEEALKKALMREMDVLDIRISSANKAGYVEVDNQALEFDKFLREAVSKGAGITTHVLQRAAMVTTNATPMIPLTINDIIKPLEEGLILSKIGIPLRTGLAGNYVWPVVGSVEATINDEAADLADSSISITELKPEPVRMGITILITNQCIHQTEGVALDVIRMQLPLAMVRLQNRAMFCTEDYNAKFHGPFANATTKVTLTTELPTYKDLLKMRGDVLNTGVDADNTQCYVMSHSMKAQLEATPRDAGSGLMIVENDRIAGVPVFCTNYINKAKAGSATAEENIGFGIWSYQPLGQFGDMRMIIDPYTEAKKDAVRITLNGDWSTTTLRKEAFAWMKCAAGE